MIKRLTALFIMTLLLSAVTAHAGVTGCDSVKDYLKKNNESCTLKMNPFLSKLSWSCPANVKISYFLDDDGKMQKCNMDNGAASTAGSVAKLEEK